MEIPSPDMFSNNIKTLANRVEALAKERDPEAEVAYNLQGSSQSMLCQFMIRGSKGQDNINITRDHFGNVGFEVVWS